MTDDISISERKLFQGNRYSTGYFVTGLSSGATAVFYITNPDGSGVDLLLDPIRLESTVEVEVRKLKNPTVSDNGTALNVINKKYDETNGNGTLAYHSPTITDRGEEFNPEIFGGGQNNKIGGGGDVGADLLPEGTSVIIEVTANNNDCDVSIDSNFVEINS
ncbi:hypothetical protein M1M34_gp010 [Haloarcula tailed virus 2]|uniref:Uncharacterized protein n=1 Tax=Haloarcula tailed virus 2 TaxID=2877989 RepID=A0AAE8XZ54_9CAUD|nr:hypothetical protein M1M34_gp010 [Haloarcula tailed virus 2]UBF23161.1 hypothetical protein HATV-2_gp10 [Haloarcula tailed virus 2]